MKLSDEKLILKNTGKTLSPRPPLILQKIRRKSTVKPNIRQGPSGKYKGTK